MIKLSSGYLYLVCFCGGTNPNTIVMTPTRPINISKDTNNLPASPKAGVRPRLDPTVLKAEVHSKTKANSEACGSSTLRTNTPRKNHKVHHQGSIGTPDRIHRKLPPEHLHPVFPRITAKGSIQRQQSIHFNSAGSRLGSPPINIKSNISNKLCNEKRSNRYS